MKANEGFSCRVGVAVLNFGDATEVDVGGFDD